MLYSGKLLACELYDNMMPPYTDVREVWEARRGRHPGRCIVTNAHWYDPGPKQCGNYKVDGVVLSNQWPNALTGLGWNTGEPKWTSHMDNYENFICTIPALINGERQNLSYGAGVERATTRTWFGRKADGEWAVEVTTTNYTLDGIVDRMEALGIVDGMVLDGSGSSQWYDGETHITGDGRTVYSYLLLWFAEDGGGGKEDDNTATYKKGIDVSQWQRTIDWDKVKASGVQFAMIRAGWGQNKIDMQFVRNISECNRLGIPCGIYWFSYAYTEAMAIREAEYALAAVEPYKLEYPIAFDWEGDSLNYAKKNGVTPTKALVSAMARAFCKRLEQAKYYAQVYTNPSYLSTYFDSDIPKQYDIWLAQWPSKPDPNSKPSQAGGIWQYTSSGSVNGISGRVDMDASYYDYPAIIEANGLNQPATSPEPEPDPDTPAKTEAELARQWVMALGISDGENPDSPCPREQVWVMLYRMNNGGNAV